MRRGTVAVAPDPAHRTQRLHCRIRLFKVKARRRGWPTARVLAVLRARRQNRISGPPGRRMRHCLSCALSVSTPNVGGVRRFVEEDLRGAEFRECELDGARFVGVVMQDVEIDGLVTRLVVNGVDVSGYVDAELDRRYPVRLLIRSQEAADLLDAWRQLDADWAATISRMRQTPGVEHQSVNEEWSAVQTLRHLVFVHDSWFRRCCLGSTDLFTSIGIGPSVEPYRQAHGLDLSLEPSLDEVVSVRQAQTAELECWLESVTPGQLATPAPVPDDDVWPPYARGRTVRQCLGTVLNEQWEHHRFTVRDLNLIGHIITSDS